MKQKNSNSKAIFNIGTNKKTFYCAITALLFLSSLCFFIQQARAEKTDLTSFPVGNQQVITMATVSISDSKIIEQKDNIFQISFDLTNRIGVQPEVKYATILIRQTGKIRTRIDEKIYPEIVNLKENQTLSKEITYTAPAYLNGAFQLWLTAQNSSGLSFSTNPLGEVKLNGNSQFLEVGPACYLKVEGQTGKKKYSIAQGVDIKNDEKLIATCQIINHFNREVTFTPGFKTYQRNTFGQLVKDNLEPQTLVSLKAQESKELSFALPKAQDPQAYDTVLTLLEEGNAISNSVAFHYVLSGQSATIQSVTLDKDYYTKGETAKLAFFWTPAADTFPNSRLGGTQSGILTAQINVTDKNGQACIDIFNKELTSQTIKEALDLSIVADCVNPQISATIKDASGQTLDQKIYSIESQNTPVITGQDPLKKYGLYGFVILVILLVVVLLAILLKRKNTIPIGLFFLIGLGIFFSGNVAKAASASYNVATNRYNVSLDKNVYDPGETITVSVDAQYTGCSNSRQDPGDVYVTIKDNKKGFHSPNTIYDVGSWAVTKTWLAGLTPGNYYATVESITPVCNPSKMNCGKWQDTCCFDPDYFYLGKIPYTVRGQCTPVNGTLSVWGACSTSACGTSGTQTRTCNDASCGGDATCGGADLSRTCTNAACAGPGVCGESHNDCSEGTLGATAEDPTRWAWGCVGSDGISVGCSELKPVDGVCAATHNNCSKGTLEPGTEYSDEFSWQWWCYGSNGGTNAQCSEQKPSYANDVEVCNEKQKRKCDVSCTTPGAWCDSWSWTAGCTGGGTWSYTGASYQTNVACCVDSDCTGSGCTCTASNTCSCPGCTSTCGNTDSYCSGVTYNDSCGNVNACTGTADCDPPTLTFTGTYGSQTDQTTLSLPAGGGNVTLNWTPTNVTSCDAWGGDTTWDVYSPSHLGGSSNRTVSSTVTYSMECWNASNVSTGVKTVQVNVATITQDPTVSIWDDPNRDTCPDETFSISWNSSRATSCTISGNGPGGLTYNPPSALSGTYTVGKLYGLFDRRKGDYIFTANCSNATGQTATDSVTHSVVACDYICTGTLPANATMFANDDVGLTVNTPYTYWATDTGTRCQYSCNSPYTWNGSACVLPPYVCTGTIPANALMYADDNTGLTESLLYQYSGTGTERKCEFYCSSGTWDGLACVTVPPGCTASCVVVNNSCSKSCGGGTRVVEFCTRANCSTYNVTEACNSQPCPPGYKEVTPW